MATIAQFQKRISSISNPKYLELIVFENIKRLEKLFLDAQKEQLNLGEDAKGKIFGTYSQASEDIAKLTNPRKPKIAGEPYNYENTGGFFDNMYLAVFEDNAQFFSDDPKTDLLTKKYKGLFGLQPDRLGEIIRTKILPVYLKEVRTQLAL